jgi:hypothetical protein
LGASQNQSASFGEPQLARECKKIKFHAPGAKFLDERRKFEKDRSVIVAPGTEFHVDYFNIQFGSEVLQTGRLARGRWPVVDNFDLSYFIGVVDHHPHSAHLQFNPNNRATREIPGQAPK